MSRRKMWIGLAGAIAAACLIVGAIPKSNSVDWRGEWQSLRYVATGSNETALAAMATLVSDAVTIPTDAQFAQIVGYSNAVSKNLTGNIYIWPDQTDATAGTAPLQGVLLTTFSLTTDGTRAGIGIGGGSAQYQSEVQEIDLRGAGKIAARITGVAADNPVEIQVRFY